MTLLAVDGLEKVFPGRPAVRAVAGVSFEVARGEAVALVGESGSGKSTIARLIARLTPATAGAIRFDGVDLAAARRVPLALRARVQMIFQDPFASLNPVHTVAYHLARPLVRHGRVRGRAALDERIRELLARVGLAPELARAHPHQLSGGQRQRVAIARALAVDPDLILADEPTSMLDASIRIEILNLLRELKERRGIALVFITHDLASARYLADRTLVLYAGHVVEAGASADVLAAPAHPYTQRLTAAIPDPRRRTPLPAPLAPTGLTAGPPPATGCPFAPRCPAVVDRCRRELPALVDAGAGRRVRCHLVPA